jgi:hypothetical protein
MQQPRGNPILEPNCQVTPCEAEQLVSQSIRRDDGTPHPRPHGQRLRPQQWRL